MCQGGSVQKELGPSRAGGRFLAIVAMKEPAVGPRVVASLSKLQARFLQIRERIETHARIYFRHVKCWFKKADYIAETIALAWKWFRRLAQKGKDATEFASTLASYAARAVNSGRRITGQVKSKDVLSEVAQQRHGFCVGKLPDFSTRSDNPLAEALIDNTRSPVPDQVHFRIDFPHWLTTRTDRDRRLIGDLALGQRTLDVSRKYGLSPARISQLRHEFHDDWRRFVGDYEQEGEAPR